jgi:hypothetical protein
MVICMSEQHVGAAVGANKAIPISDGIAQTVTSLEVDACAACDVDIDEVVLGSRVEQGAQRGSSHLDDELHRAHDARLDPGEHVQ